MAKNVCTYFDYRNMKSVGAKGKTEMLPLICNP